jgi:hypothetical protein
VRNVTDREKVSVAVVFHSRDTKFEPPWGLLQFFTVNSDKVTAEPTWSLFNQLFETGYLHRDLLIVQKLDKLSDFYAMQRFVFFFTEDEPLETLLSHMNPRHSLFLQD